MINIKAWTNLSSNIFTSSINLDSEDYPLPRLSIMFFLYHDLYYDMHLFGSLKLMVLFYSTSTASQFQVRSSSITLSSKSQALQMLQPDLFFPLDHVSKSDLTLSTFFITVVLVLSISLQASLVARTDHVVTLFHQKALQCFPTLPKFRSTMHYLCSHPL